jgi:hypothetical protein
MTCPALSFDLRDSDTIFATLPASIRLIGTILDAGAPQRARCPAVRQDQPGRYWADFGKPSFLLARSNHSFAITARWSRSFGSMHSSARRRRRWAWSRQNAGSLRRIDVLDLAKRLLGTEAAGEPYLWVGSGSAKPCRCYRASASHPQCRATFRAFDDNSLAP